MTNTKFAVPPGATDCHHHIYDARYPADPAATKRPPDALIPAYRALQEQLGTSRNIIVQPSTYGTDNRCMLDALDAFEGNARGVAVVAEDVADAELRAMDARGVRGIRFNLRFPAGAGTHAMEQMAQRIAPLGWHMQVNGSSDQIAAQAERLARLECPVVFDHMVMLAPPNALNHPAFKVVGDLLASGRAWMKLSGAYYGSKIGPPTYADIAEIPRAFEKISPNRVIWGTNWPHPAHSAAHMPDDVTLMDLLADWFPADIRQRILVDNPAALYGFR
jgi:D-galactarolactone isomerase